MHYSRSDDAVIRVYDEAGNVIATHEHKGTYECIPAQRRKLAFQSQEYLGRCESSAKRKATAIVNVKPSVLAWQLG